MAVVTAQRAISLGLGEVIIDKSAKEEKPFYGFILKNSGILFKTVQTRTSILYFVGAPQLRTKWDIQNAYFNFTNGELFQESPNKNPKILYLNLNLKVGQLASSVTKLKFVLPKESKREILKTKLVALESIIPLEAIKVQPVEFEVSMEVEVPTAGEGNTFVAIIVENPTLEVIFSQTFDNAR